MINQLWDFIMYVISQTQVLWDFLFSPPQEGTAFGDFLLSLGINAPVYIIFSSGFIVLFITIKIIFSLAGD